MPYSPLAGGHLSHTDWDSASKRSQTDNVLKAKYDKAKDNDMEIIARVDKLSKEHNVSMSQIALAWHYAKGVASPIVGATNPAHFSDAVKAVDLVLTKEEIDFLEEPYRAHEVVGPITAEEEDAIVKVYTYQK